MNGVALLDLALAIASQVPSEAAIPHASLEWKHVRRQWIAALKELGLTEARAREMAAQIKVYQPTNTDHLQ